MSLKYFSRKLFSGAPRRMKKLRMTAQMMLGILNLEPSIRKRPAVDEISKSMGRWGQLSGFLLLMQVLMLYKQGLVWVNINKLKVGH